MWATLEELNRAEPAHVGIGEMDGFDDWDVCLE